MLDAHFETAKNSELIFTLNGRHLCSSVHPTREAQQWISHHQNLWQHCEAILVLGLGCGYHIRALKMATEASVYVLEPSRKVIEGALRVHPLDLRESEIISWNAIEDVAGSKPLMKATNKPYAVLVHEPSAFLYPELYSQTKEFLLGRKEEGLRWLFQNRGMQMPSFDETVEINLKTLDPLWRRQMAGEEPVQPVMQALRELIA